MYVNLGSFKVNINYKQCSDSAKHAKFNIVWITLLIAFTPYTQVIDVNLRIFADIELKIIISNKLNLLNLGHENVHGRDTQKALMISIRRHKSSK